MRLTAKLGLQSVLLLTLILPGTVRVDASSSSANAEFEYLFRNDAIRKAALSVWALSINGRDPSHIEWAFNVERADDGALSATEVVSSYESRRTNLRTPSAYTIALFHTHPNDCKPWPSANDRAIADAWTIPILTISRDGIYQYDPGRKTTTQIYSGMGWTTSRRKANN
jgi:proteasome lid subunit RPN8/RPN11